MYIVMLEVYPASCVFSFQCFTNYITTVAASWYLINGTTCMQTRKVQTTASKEEDVLVETSLGYGYVLLLYDEQKSY